MWAAVMIAVPLCAGVVMLALIGNVLYSIFQELVDQGEQARAARARTAPPVPPRAPVRPARTGPPEG